MSTVNQNEPGEIELLLPWHAAGTLSHRDTQRVEAALANDPELARRYELVREELGQTIYLNESLGAPSARAMTALFAKIDAEPARAPALSGRAVARLREFFGSLSPRTLAWSASAAALAIMLQAAVIAGVVYKDNGVSAPGKYQTASVQPATVTGGTYALVRFQPQASAAEVASFLESNELTVEGGPSAGFFRVRIAAKKLPQADVTAILRKLQDAKVVSFVSTTD